MPKKVPLMAGKTYHIFNRGNNRQLIFRDHSDYEKFLFLVRKYLFDVCDIYCYALLPNHFHFLIKINSEIELNKVGITESSQISRRFGNLFNAFAKRNNLKYNQVSSLFEHRFERVQVFNELKFVHLIHYIHWNPQKHGYTDNYEDWKYTSFNEILEDKKSFVYVRKKEVLKVFGSKENLVKDLNEYIAEMKLIKEE